MSIRWIRDVLVDGKHTTIEVLLGLSRIADKCYVRIDAGEECWFTPVSDSREEILRQGVAIIKNMFTGKSVLNPSGTDFNWV